MGALPWVLLFALWSSVAGKGCKRLSTIPEFGDIYHVKEECLDSGPLRFIHSKNRPTLPSKLALNHLADRTPAEMAVLRGRLKSGAPNNGQPFPSEGYTGLILPESLDWRLYGAVTPVKDQALCGSCWSFAVTGAMEGALFLKTGVVTPLSQQVLIDCSWGFGNYGCDGGEEWSAYEWIKKHGGIASTDSYGLGGGEWLSSPLSVLQNGLCHYNKSELVGKMKGYVNVTSGNITALKAAIYKNGPVAVSIDASQRSFSFYSNGVYYEPKCGTLHPGSALLRRGVSQGAAAAFPLPEPRQGLARIA
ncbi:Cathepsin L [Chelonia mydas]|uniref:Cathepsin L n=1 Tax=Chelonia mydas TaxID=8469 RepID=M7B204_CHEMY|nr:Cathepsin L [Chelonia mydas]